MEHRAAQIAQRNHLSATVRSWDHSAPQPLDSHVRELILRAIDANGQPPQALPSWAGHDAAVFARHIPAGMIFVTSSGGVSHAPGEHTPWPAVETGAQVLLDTLLLLDEEPGEATLPLAYAGGRSP